MANPDELVECHERGCHCEQFVPGGGNAIHPVLCQNLIDNPPCVHLDTPCEECNVLTAQIEEFSPVQDYTHIINPRKEPYQEKRCCRIFTVFIEKMQNGIERVVVRLSGINLDHHDFDLGSKDVIDTFYNNVGRVHTGCYDHYVKELEK
jgi:hypothetical protein